MKNTLLWDTVFQIGFFKEKRFVKFSGKAAVRRECWRDVRHRE